MWAKDEEHGPIFTDAAHAIIILNSHSRDRVEIWNAIKGMPFSNFLAVLRWCMLPQNTLLFSSEYVMVLRNFTYLWTVWTLMGQHIQLKISLNILVQILISLETVVFINFLNIRCSSIL